MNLKRKKCKYYKNHLLFNDSFDFKKWSVLLVVWLECVLGLKQCMLMSWIVKCKKYKTVDCKKPCLCDPSYFLLAPCTNLPFAFLKVLSGVALGYSWSWSSGLCFQQVRLNFDSHAHIIKNWVLSIQSSAKHILRFVIVSSNHLGGKCVSSKCKRSTDKSPKNTLKTESSYCDVNSWTTNLKSVS